MVNPATERKVTAWHSLADDLHKVKLHESLTIQTYYAYQLAA